MKKFITIFFILIQLISYYLILFIGGNIGVYASFISIVLCFLYAFTNVKIENRYLLCGLVMTIGADFFLVLYEPREQLYGMIFFVFTQIFYAIKLNKETKNKIFIFIRVILSVLINVIAFIVLKDSIDLLVIVSLIYYVNIILNFIEALTIFRKDRLFTIGLLLFILCDTVIGLQVMSDAYIKISETSILYKILFVDFNLAWAFYLPSQVLIALSSNKKEGVVDEI